MTFSFEVLAKDGLARIGKITTPHGVIETPAFMPVGTAATVKGLYPQQVAETGAQILLCNTYHMMMRPGAEQVAALGGLHAFMVWDKPILTDSGGFQVMSLSSLRKLDEDGVTFASHIDGSKHRLTPERAVEVQALLGADIQMQLDECIRLPAEGSDIARAMRLSLRWAERAKTEFTKRKLAAEGKALYAIVQGGDSVVLRQESARALVDMDFQGYAVGGLAVGEPQDVMLAMLKETLPILPEDKPHYLMGVGTPDDLLKAIVLGIDQFDCVLPTRNARHGTAYTRFGKINLRNAKHANDKKPLDEESSCAAARDYSRAYLHHLIKSGEMLGAMMLTAINLSYFQDLMRGAREAIKAGRYQNYMQDCQKGWQRAGN
ncbi:MAG: tRNA guanosine(34) transglycosylase Tgt [Pseudomonadota bacterium]